MPELLTYQWSPATAYAAVNSIAELNQKRSQQAQSMALQLAELAQKHDEEAERAAEAAKKLDYDQQHQMRVEAIAGARDATSQANAAARLGETRRHNMASELLANSNSPAGFVPHALPNDAPPTSATRPSMADTLSTDGQPALPSGALDQTDVPLVPDSTPAPVSKRGSQLAMQATGSFPFSADQVQEYNQAGFAGGQKAATQALQTSARANEQIRVAKEKADLKVTMPSKPRYDPDAEISRLGLTADPKTNSYADKDGIKWKFGVNGRYTLTNESGGGSLLTPTQESFFSSKGTVIQEIQKQQPILDDAGLKFTSDWNGPDSDFQKAIDGKKITRGQAEIANHWLTEFKKIAGPKPAGTSKAQEEDRLNRAYSKNTALLAPILDKGVKTEGLLPVETQKRIMDDRAQRENAAGVAAPATAAPVAAPAAYPSKDSRPSRTIGGVTKYWNGTTWE